MRILGFCPVFSLALVYRISSLLIQTVLRGAQNLFGSHKQLKTLLRDHMVKLKIISLYIYKDLRLKT